MSGDTETLLDRLLARFEHTPGFLAWWKRIGDEEQDDLLLDADSIIQQWVKEGEE